MARKRLRPEEIVSRLRQVDVQQSQGKSATEAIRVMNVTEAPYYLNGRLSRWKSILF